MRQWICLFAFSACIAILTGCGNSVSGTVSFKGDPVKYGTISIR